MKFYRNAKSLCEIMYSSSSDDGEGKDESEVNDVQERQAEKTVTITSH